MLYLTRDANCTFTLWEGGRYGWSGGGLWVWSQEAKRSWRNFIPGQQFANMERGGSPREVVLITPDRLAELERYERELEATPYALPDA